MSETIEMAEVDKLPNKSEKLEEINYTRYANAKSIKRFYIRIALVLVVLAVSAVYSILSVYLGGEKERILAEEINKLISKTLLDYLSANTVNIGFIQQTDTPATVDPE